MPTRYSPVRYFPSLPLSEDLFRNFSFNLHVLGMPPAFILSQDQTLKNNFLLRSYLPASFKKSCWLNCYSSPRLRSAFELTWYYLVFLLFEIVKFLGFLKPCGVCRFIAPLRSNESYYSKDIMVCQYLFLIFFERVNCNSKCPLFLR